MWFIYILISHNRAQRYDVRPICDQAVNSLKIYCILIFLVLCFLFYYLAIYYCVTFNVLHMLRDAKDNTKCSVSDDHITDVY